MATTKTDIEDTPRYRRGYRGLTAAELDQQRYERIVDAAITLFGELGYNNTRIDRICSCAHVSTRHFYEQFKNRTAVLAAVHDKITATLRDEVRSAITCHDNELTERLGRAIENTMYRLASDPDQARILCVECVGVSEAMEHRRRAAMREAVVLVRRYTEHMVHQGKLPRRNYYLVAVGLVGLLNELLVEWLSEPAGLDARQMADHARSMFMAMLLHS